MQPISRRRVMGLAAAAMAAPAVLGLASCSNASGGGGDGKSLRILQYEDPSTPQGVAWARAVEIFQEQHPDVEVDFQQTSFDAMRQSARITLSGSDVPDVVEFNKGNADGGTLAGQGLLTDLTDVVTERGWDQKVTGAMQSFARYEDGLAGSGAWYGIPNFGEYVNFYYNKELFAEAGVDVESFTGIEEFEAGLQSLLDAGITPISSSAATSQGFNQMWIWYSLVSAYASRQEIDDFMFLQGPVDFNADPWRKATLKFQEWIDKKYTGERISGLNFEQATVNFLSGDAGMVMWNHSILERVKSEATFEWGHFTMPGAQHVMGSSGHLWGVPERASNKELAYDFIDITLGEEVQNLLGAQGGLPLGGDTSLIEDPVIRDYTEGFVELMDNNQLSFYPDYPVTGFLDFIQEHMQAMSNQNETGEEYLQALQTFYDDGAAR